MDVIFGGSALLSIAYNNLKILATRTDPNGIQHWTYQIASLNNQEILS